MNNEDQTPPIRNATSAESTAPEAAGPQLERKSSVTPMFAASQAARYQRQDLIRKIEAEMDTSLICFICGHRAQIERDDIAGFVDLLHNISPGKKVSLLLQTPGGDVDAAEKILALLRATTGFVEDYKNFEMSSAKLKIVIPDSAKSAGTLIALGADALVMGDTSELGTIDPQVWLWDSNGNEVCHSIVTYLDSYKLRADEFRKNPSDPVASAMIQKFDPAVIRKYEMILQRAREFAERQLERRGKNFTEITSALLSTEKWPSHSQMIGWHDAQKLGLDIEHRSKADAVWLQYWQLYCLQRSAIRHDQKLFESSIVSLPFDS